jgi:ParB-like nuclease domain
MPEYITSTVSLDRLTPFAENSALFSDSLAPASIEALADDIEKHGLSQPILTADVPCEDGIGTDLTVVDGHRRERAFRLLQERHPGDPKYKAIPHRHLGAMTREQVLARVLDCFSSARQATPREQASLYTAMVERLKREHGLAHGGRKVQDGRSANLPANEIYDEAARRVGVSSSRLARDLVRVFREGAPELQDLVNRGEVAVSTAVSSLRAGGTSQETLRGSEAPSVETSQEKPSEAPELPAYRHNETNAGNTRAVPTEPPKVEDLVRHLGVLISGSGFARSVVLEGLGASGLPRVPAPSGDAEKLVRGILAKSEDLARGVCSGLMLRFGFAVEEDEDEDEDEDPEPDLDDFEPGDLETDPFA